MNRTFLAACGLALLLICACVPVNAQVLYGSLTGNVSDPSGAAIPNAKVEVLNSGTGLTRSMNTDERGAYLFTNLQTGVYKLTVSAPSFQTVVKENVTVLTNQVVRSDFSLAIAATTESVNVSAEGIVLQTEKGSVEHTINQQEVAEIPYNGGQGRNFQSLLYMVPGAGIPAAREANSDAGNPARAQTLFMNGQSSTGNSTRLDGTVIAYPWLPVNIAYVPPPDAIQQVNVVTDAFDAEQGAAGGAAINVTIKSGTNDIHGGLFEYNQNNAETAVAYFAHTSTAPPPKNVFNQFGFFVGGPVWIPKVVHGKNKLFWFFDWQGTRRNQYAATYNLTLPNAAWRQGDFSALNCPALGGTGAQNQCIYDPLTGNKDGTGRQVFPGNKIPTQRLSSAAQTLAGTLPALARPNNFFSNADVYGLYYFHTNKYDAKINYNPSDKLNIWGGYSRMPMDIYAPLQLGPIAGGDAFNAGNPGHAGGLTQTSRIGFTYTFSPTLIVDGNFGYTRQNIGADGDEYNGFYGRDVLKIPGTNGDSTVYMGVPGFQVAGIANIGNTNTGSPFLFRDNQYTTGYNLSKIHGAHNLRFGFQYDHSGLNHFQPQGGTFGTARGTFGFDGNLTNLCNASAANGSCANFNTVNNGAPFNSWAQFMLGDPSRMGKITQFRNPNALRFSDYSFYARDQWQVNRKLTLNFGLRWEYYPIFSHDHYGAVRYDPATYSILIGGLGSTPWDAGASATHKDFAPRFGFAERLTSKTVVRGGYGITIDPDNFRNQRNAYPAVVNQDYQPAFTGQFITNAGVASGSTLVTGIPAPTAPDISSGVIPSACPNATCTGTLVGTPANYLPSLSTTTFPKYFNRGYIQTWNLFVQHEFTNSFVGEVGYVGAHALRLQIAANINGSLPGTGNAGRNLAPFDTTDMNSYMPFGANKYEALQTRFRKRFGSSFLTVSYTFSKAMNNFGDNGDGTLFRTWPVSTALDWGLAGFDRKHTLQIGYVLQAPFGKGHRYMSTGVPAAILGGWQLSGTLGRFSGVPFTVTASAAVNAGGQTQTANQVNPAVAILGGHDPNHPYFDGTAFANPATNTLGSTGRNILRGPGVFNTDVRLARSFNLWKEGRVKFQILGEAFNLTNTPNFANPNTGCSASPSCYVVNSNGSNNGFGTINNTVNTGSLTQNGGQRQLQVGARLTF